MEACFHFLPNRPDDTVWWPADTVSVQSHGEGIRKKCACLFHFFERERSRLRRQSIVREFSDLSSVYDITISVILSGLNHVLESECLCVYIDPFRNRFLRLCNASRLFTHLCSPKQIVAWLPREVSLPSRYATLLFLLHNYVVWEIIAMDNPIFPRRTKRVEEAEKWKTFLRNWNACPS